VYNTQISSNEETSRVQYFKSRNCDHYDQNMVTKSRNCAHYNQNMVSNSRICPRNDDFGCYVRNIQSKSSLSSSSSMVKRKMETKRDQSSKQQYHDTAHESRALRVFNRHRSTSSSSKDLKEMEMETETEQRLADAKRLPSFISHPNGIVLPVFKQKEESTKFPVRRLMMMPFLNIASSNNWSQILHH